MSRYFWVETGTEERVGKNKGDLRMILIERSFISATRAFLPRVWAPSSSLSLSSDGDHGGHQLFPFFLFMLKSLAEKLSGTTD